MNEIGRNGDHKLPLYGPENPHLGTNQLYKQLLLGNWLVLKTLLKRAIVKDYQQTQSGTFKASNVIPADLIFIQCMWGMQVIKF